MLNDCLLSGNDAAHWFWRCMQLGVVGCVVINAKEVNAVGAGNKHACNC